MTEELEDVVQDNDPVADAESPADEPKKSFTSDVVKKVVEREKAKAFERGKREALMELQQQQQLSAQDNMGAQQQSQIASGTPSLSQADVERLIAEKAPQALQQQVKELQQQQMINTFAQKMQLAEQQHPGLESELNNLNYKDYRMESFLSMVTPIENAGDIMKEMTDNPAKMESLLNMAYNQPYQAQKALKSLSDSIKTNQSAKAEEVKAHDPLSQIKSSTTSGNKESSQHDMSGDELLRYLRGS